MRLTEILLLFVAETLQTNTKAVIINRETNFRVTVKSANFTIRSNEENYLLSWDLGVLLLCSKIYLRVNDER